MAVEISLPRVRIEFIQRRQLQGGPLQKLARFTIERGVRILIVTTLLALLTGYAILSFSSRKDTLDFAQFYAAGQMLRHGLGAQLYDLSAQMSFQSALARVHTFYSHPPFEALLFAPFALVSYKTAYALWTVFSLSLLIFAACLLERAAGISATLSSLLRFPADLGLVIVIFAMFSPVTTCLLIGQDSLLLVAFFSLMYLLLARNFDFAAGCALACTLFKFQFAIPFAIVLLFAHKWRALQGFATAGAVLFGISIGISGPNVLVAYPRLLFQEKIFQQLGDLSYVPNIRGLLALIFREHGRLFLVLVAIVSLLVLWAAGRNWREHRVTLSFSAAVLASLLASYHAYSYDLSFLLLPISLLLTEIRENWESHPIRVSNIANVVFFTSLVPLFIPPLHLWLIVHRLYMLMAIPVAAIFAASLQFIRTTGKRPVSEP